MEVGPGDPGSSWRGRGGVGVGVGGRLREELSLTCTVLVRRGRLLRQLGPLFGPCDCRVSGVQALRHLFADDVHQALEGLLDVDVVLGAGLEELKACRGGRGLQRRLPSIASLSLFQASS